MSFTMEYLESILANWDIQGNIQYGDNQGLINHTYLIGSPTLAVLQWVNGIFHPDIHWDIQAITQHLLAKRLPTTTLIPTKDGALCFEDTVNGGTWRMLTFIPGTTIHSIQNPKVAYEAGKLVGTFHNAMQDFEHTWRGPKRDAHNTPIRMENLKEALNASSGHHLEQEAGALAEQILDSWQKWEGQLDLPPQVCHGDLKISNLHFNSDFTGLCLLDLDTLSIMDYSVEMGDAWRSWCNPAGESNLEATRFDLGNFEASAKGWLEQVSIQRIEKENLVAGIERICLELAARFCADALQNTYFKEDLTRYPIIGSHNLLRAQTQFKLAQSVLHQRSQAEKIINS